MSSCSLHITKIQQVSKVNVSEHQHLGVVHKGRLQQEERRVGSDADNGEGV